MPFPWDPILPSQDQRKQPSPFIPCVCDLALVDLLQAPNREETAMDLDIYWPAITKEKAVANAVLTDLPLLPLTPSLHICWHALPCAWPLTDKEKMIMTVVMIMWTDSGLAQPPSP